MKKIFILLAAVLIMFGTGCSSGGGSDPIPPPSSSVKEITAFSLNGVAGTINETAKTIAVTLPYGTSVNNLVATFTTTGASVQVGSIVQISGTTANDFTLPVVYTVTAIDATTQNYIVVVIVALSSEKAMTAFSLNGVAGTINETEKTIAITLPYGTSVDNLVATFTSTGASVQVGSSDPLTYIVTAPDGTKQIYTLIITVAPSSAKAMTAFSLNGVAGTINETEKTIAVTMPYGTSVTNLVATFTTTGANVKVGSTVQESGTTAHNFTSPVIYTVTAYDSSTQDYNVTVTVAPSPAKAITAFSLDGVAGTINESWKYILVRMPPGTPVTALVATFSTSGASVQVGSTVQITGITANDFTFPVRYTVTAADGTTQDYIVFVALTASDEPFSSSLTAVDDNPLGTKIPLILIHGLHGKPITGFWQNFISYFNSNTSLTSKYKLYQFKYDSDKESVNEIGQELEDDIADLSDFTSKNFVIMAHSMGGLVARSYMQEHGGSDRIIKLITLATPHHGSPLANNTPRIGSLDNPFLAVALPFVDSAFWCRGNLLYNTICLSGDYVDITEPNRKDMLWDSYDNLNANAPYNTCPECNTWLRSLNSSSGSCNDKLILYYGFLNSANSSIYDSLATLGASDLGYYLYEHRNDKNVQLAGASVILYHVYLAGDGLVPYDSGKFKDGVGILETQRREFPGYNHDQMKDGVVVNGTIPLFDWIKSDLDSI
jgi:pimeloyl-ACP methyl ester carboxylesterase